MIDDDPMIQRLFGAKLASSGFEVLYAHSAHSGREMARRLLPDLILLDIRMPETDGFAIARRLKEEPRTKNIPIIFLTNQDLSMEAEKWANDLGIVDYIHKSTDLGEVVDRIKKALGHSSQKTTKKNKHKD